MAKRKIGFFVLVFLIFIFLGLAFYFLWQRYHYITTDAVFVQADRLIYLSFPKVNGKLIKLYKKEGDRVQEGEILAELEPLDYQANVSSLEENFKKLKEEERALLANKAKVEREILIKKEQIQRQIESLKFKKDSLEEEIAALEAKLSLVEKDRKRLEKLYQEGLISLQTLETQFTQERELKHQILSQKAQLQAIERDIKALEKNLALVENERFTVENLKSQISALQYQAQSLKLEKERAQLYYNYTKLISPISGIIVKKFHSEGDVINPSEPVYAVIDPKTFYILVLLEETKLPGIKEGAKAKIKLEAYPGKVWEGEVENILSASAATFALVPRDISAGEFTKLAQRIPIRIKITKGDYNLLRVGLGGEVKIQKIH